MTMPAPRNVLLALLIAALAVPVALIGAWVVTELVGGVGDSRTGDVSGTGVICIVDGPRYGGHAKGVFQRGDGGMVMVSGSVLVASDGERVYGVDTWYIDPRTCETGFVMDPRRAVELGGLEWVDDKYIYLGPGSAILDKRGRVVARHVGGIADMPSWRTALWSRTSNLVFYYADRSGNNVVFKAVDLLNMQVAWVSKYPEPLTAMRGFSLELAPTSVTVSGKYVYAVALVHNYGEKRLGVVAYKVDKASGELLARVVSMATVPGLSPQTQPLMLGGGYNLPLVVDSDKLLAGVHVVEIFEGKGLLALFAFDMSGKKPLWISHLYVSGGVGSYKLLSTDSGFVVVVQRRATTVHRLGGGLRLLASRYTVMLLDKATGDTLAVRDINATHLSLVADSAGDSVYVAYQVRPDEIIVEALDAGRGLERTWFTRVGGGDGVIRVPFSLTVIGDRVIISYTEVPRGSARAYYRVAVLQGEAG